MRFLLTVWIIAASLVAAGALAWFGWQFLKLLDRARRESRLREERELWERQVASGPQGSDREPFCFRDGLANGPLFPHARGRV